MFTRMILTKDGSYYTVLKNEDLAIFRHLSGGLNRVSDWDIENLIKVANLHDISITVRRQER